MRGAYKSPVLARGPQRQLDQGLFDFLVPYRKPTLLPGEAAKCIGRSIHFVYDLIQAGKLESLEQAAKGTRPVYLVTRRSVLLYMASTANFEPGDFQLCVDSFIESCDASLCEHIVRSATLRRANLARLS